jgi:uncharacterized protein (TIGR02217 family)
VAFIETPRFPDDIAYGSSGGPNYKTSVVMFASGREKRNISWSQSRHSYNVGYGVRSETQLDAMLEFFHSMQGRAHSFRYKDFADFHTATPGGYGANGEPFTAVNENDQQFGVGDGAETVFQLVKNYTTGSLTTARDITKPISGTVLIAVNAVLQTETTHYTIDYTTGLVTFVTPPPMGELVTWGGQFDVPCRFDSDDLSTSLEQYSLGDIDVRLVEVRV